MSIANRKTCMQLPTVIVGDCTARGRRGSER